ncbi:Rhodanese-related sulfurtransferase [Thermoplasmatales archaeon SCGC AB-539-C06]|nr:Rhodanese-related sulfurtransferase [Thermoplasmatales archaeon SCGC AB-539-C06]
MQNNPCQKWLAIGITVLFLGLIFISSASALTKKNKQIVDIPIGISLNSDGYIDITVEEAWALLNDTSNGVQIPIDVRTDSEWANEHINTPAPENPKHYCACAWGNETILQEFISIYEGKEIIIYCRSGSRSVTASNMLVDNGFVGTIYNMLGGINAWKTAEFPTIGNLPPERPIITGAINGKAGNEYEYTIVTNDPEDDIVYYFVNWSDNTSTLNIGPFASGEEVTVSHSWVEQDTYVVKVKSWDYYQAESNWTTLEVSMPKNIQITNNNNPPNPPEITGPLFGKIGEVYVYYFTVTDPDENDGLWELEIDFGDEIIIEKSCDSGECVPWKNGETVEIRHMWKSTGTYELTARVMDTYGELSEWSDPLSVRMPKNKPYLNTPFLRFLENHPYIFPLLRQLLGL